MDHGRGECGDIVFTLPGLISILSKKYRSATIENNINVRPGTSGKVGNGWRNWSYFSPPIETMVQTSSLKHALKELGTRQFQPFDYFHELKETKTGIEGLQIIYSKPANRSIIYRGSQKTWIKLELPTELTLEKIELELIIRNDGEEEIWQRIDLGKMLDLEDYNVFNFQDLNSERECYSYSSEDLATNLFFIRLQPNQIHHFLVYKESDKIPIQFED